MALISRIFLPVLCLGAVLALAGCGYSFQHTRNPMLEVYQVRKIYVAPLLNDTFKPGVENLVYNELLRVISQNRRVQMVFHEEDADAVLHGDVTGASYASAGSILASNLSPLPGQVPGVNRISLDSLYVPHQYSAVLSGSFSLELRPNAIRPARVIWADSFAKSQIFPGNNQLSTFGTTGPLINESEFDRTLRELARSVMADLHESMLAMF